MHLKVIRFFLIDYLISFESLLLGSRKDDYHLTIIHFEIMLLWDMEYIIEH